MNSIITLIKPARFSAKLCTRIPNPQLDTSDRCTWPAMEAALFSNGADSIVDVMVRLLHPTLF